MLYERHTPHSLSDWQRYLSHDEINWLEALAKSLPEHPTVLNIGAGAGTSAMVFLSSRPDLNLVTIDVTYEINPLGGIQNEQGILEAAGLLDYTRYRTIHADSVYAGRDWMDGDVDMVFVDGDHTLEGCTGDILAWLPHIKANGVMVLHDYRKLEAYVSAHPDENVTDALIAHTIKPYRGVDEAVYTHLRGKQSLIGVVDTLIAFRIAHGA